jgi:hypothetical protein
VLLAFRIVAPGIGPTLKGDFMEMLLLARAKYLLDRVSNNVKYPTLDGSPALPPEAAALIECLRNLGLVEDADAMHKDFIVHFAHETRLPNTGLDPRLVEFRSKANELFGPFLKYSRPEGDGTVVRLRLIDHFDGLRITFKKLSMLSSPLTPPQNAGGECPTGGVSLYDVAFAVNEDDALAKECVKKWVDSKKLTASPIGSCPLDARRKLYRLSEILSDVQRIIQLEPREVDKYRQALTAKLRLPRSD